MGAMCVYSAAIFKTNNGCTNKGSADQFIIHNHGSNHIYKQHFLHEKALNEFGILPFFSIMLHNSHHLLHATLETAVCISGNCTI